MNTPEIATAVPGTVKAWFTPHPDLDFTNLPPGPWTNEPNKMQWLDFTNLPPGPWTNEPNKMQWVDAATGLPCLIVRGGVASLCGYVGVPPTHPFHKRDYDSVDVDVHGGLTFSNSCQHAKDESQGICHIPEPGTSDDVWWFGFDCAHLDDLSPGMLRHGFKGFGHDVYRDVNYVANEVTSLAAQLAKRIESQDSSG